MLLRTERVLLLRAPRGRSVRIVREHYLREDVPCASCLCPGGCIQAPGGKQLPEDLTHYVVPDWMVVQNYLEILEMPELRGLIFTQTACQAVQHYRGRRQYNKLRNLLRDPRHDCILFANEFQRYSYLPREKDEPAEKWQTRCIYNASAWYYHHCVEQIPIVMVTEDEEAIQQYGSETGGVFVISLKSYLENFLPDLLSAQELYDSISQAKQERESEAQNNHGKEYPEHLPLQVLEAGIKSGRYIQGVLNVNKHRAQLEAFVRLEGTSSKESDLRSDILIHGNKARNRAIHGDVVAVEMLPKNEWKGRLSALSENEPDDKTTGEAQSELMPTGRVIGVIQKNWRDYVVTFPSKEETQSQARNAQKILVTPWDYRIPRIRISTHQAEALQDCRVIVRLDAWEANSLYPNGHFVSVLGKIGDLEVEISTILVENSICVAPFSEAQMREMPSPETPWSISPQEEQQRVDLRDTHLVFSIDPKGCEDVDDALSIRSLANGNLELGVHIADVTHFVAVNSHTDIEARTRATTYYLPDRRYDMLPSVLSADLCSLLGGVDSIPTTTFSDIMQPLLDKCPSIMARNHGKKVIQFLCSTCVCRECYVGAGQVSYEILKVWYGRTIIRSAYKLYYEAAQRLLDGDLSVANDIPEIMQMGENAQSIRLEELRVAVQRLTDVAKHVRAKRDIGGALELEGVEVRVQLDDKKNIDDLLPKQPLEVHETIAECMILANHWVAKKIWKSFPHQALLRLHPPPCQDFFTALRECAEAKGFYIDTRNNKALADSLEKAHDPAEPLVNKLLRSMATQAMSVAEYFSTGSHAEDQFYHYGLALDKYTHFTSPIRRYADIVVHRLLLAAICKDRQEEDRESLFSNKDLVELCKHINNRNRAAQHCQKQSTELFQCMYFKEKDPSTDPRCLADAIIYSIRTNGVLLFVPRFGIKGAAYLKNKEGLVISCHPGGGSEWHEGSLQRSQHSIIATPVGAESVSFGLFDHVTVRISVQTSRCHTATIRLEIVSNQPYQSPETEILPQNSQLTKSELVKEVTRSAEEAQLAHREATTATILPQEEYEEYRQSLEPSLYALLEEIQDLALLDVSKGEAPDES